MDQQSSSSINEPNKGELNSRPRREELKLDLDNVSSERKKKFQSILTSPDLKMLKLATPELENLIRSQATLFTPTPSLLFPKSITEEQELFARGFLDALDNIKHHYQNFTMNKCSLENNARYFTRLQHNLNSIKPYSGNIIRENMFTNEAKFIEEKSDTTSQHPVEIDSNAIQIIEPSSQSLSKPITNSVHAPIDLKAQEQIKIERKKLRNRIAATRCRKRKLDKIAELEKLTNGIKNHIEHLQKNIETTKVNIGHLRIDIDHHIQGGCAINIASL